MFGSTPSRWSLSRALAWGFAVFTGLASAADLPVVKACGHHDYPPWNWQRGDQIVGACAEVTRRAIERLGYRVDLSYVGPWKRCQAMVASGEVDVNICSFRNAEREAYSVFTEPRMAQNRIAIFVHKPQAAQRRFEGWSDLKGLRSGLVLGVSMGKEFDDFLEQNTHIERVVSMKQTLNMLAMGRVDFAPFGWEAGLIEIERNGLAGRIVPLAQPALVGELYVSVSKKSPLASRVQEIGAYFMRPDYPAELDALLDAYHRLYLDGVRLPETDRARAR
jgi:polar amino acid transport system substrate-binding protein